MTETLTTTRINVPPNSPQAVDALLNLVVQKVTGLPAPDPRPGQVQLAHAAATVLSYPAEPVSESGKANWGPHHLIGVAPTGTGKAIAGLVPAALQAVQGKRTLFSTESLSLQAQIIDKDFPVVADACEELFGVRPRIALHKGFSNYVCMKAAVDKYSGELGANETELKKQSADNQIRTLMDLLDQKALRAFVTGTNTDLARWALSHGLASGKAAGGGDKSTFEGVLDDLEWSTLSIASNDCAKADCPFFTVCSPLAARQFAADADVVVTNHALLGVQAANQVPVVLGSKALGEFTSIIVDEAHALPGWVRSQGANQLSGKSVDLMAARLERDLVISPELAVMMRAVPGITKALNHDLDAAVKAAAPKGARPGEALEVKPDDVLASSGDMIEDWCTGVAGWLDKALTNLDFHDRGWLPMRRLANATNQLKESVTVLRQPSKHVARWLMLDARTRQMSKSPRNPQGKSGAADVVTLLQSSPVDVSWLLRDGLWTRSATESEVFRWRKDGLINEEPEIGSDGKPVFPDATMAVVVMSATLPVGFGRQAGLSGRTQEFESPFEDCYDQSLAFIPSLTADDVQQLTRMGGKGMDVSSHRSWVVPKIMQLVEANSGSALVLSATAAGGKVYVEALRARFAGTGIRIHSQWDGVSMRQTVAAWRDDVSSVLVGTRSMMTGVDAPGRTCSLVILDRVPRSAGNPVDDARVNLLVEDGVADNKWDGDRFVYVADARLLMEQAVGRLIRSISDVGMAAVLDPRLLKDAGKMAYNERARKMMLRPLLRFNNRVTDEAEALDWLRANAAAHQERLAG